MKERLREGLLLKFNGKQGNQTIDFKWEACYMKHYIMKHMGG